ncbi:secretory subunit [Perkinsus olseni]|uniref:5'-nucleotidase n=1 Tax=Perkinsus olseni TaxID=32597 RepID=A0A7J6MFJ3_PEROL|nr:secretory subunit [Perkinsus olseni]
MSEESPCVDGKRGELIVTEQLLRSQLAAQEHGESRGVWDAEACKVTVTSRSGKALQSIAPNRRDLNLEEALYLAERGSLVVDGLRAEDLWRLLERMGQRAVDAYLVYANLKRAGYDVQRGRGFEDRQPPLLFTVTTSDSAAVRGEFDVVVVSSAYTRFGEAELPTDRQTVVAVVEMGTVIHYVSPGVAGQSCHGIFETYPKFTDDFFAKSRSLVEKYYPIEMDPTMAREEKHKHMDYWWTESEKLICEQEVYKHGVEEVVDFARRSNKFALRSMAPEMLQMAHEQSVPVTILSAGIGNIIEYILKGYDALFLDNATIVSNIMQFDADTERLVSFRGPQIHCLTKKSALTDYIAHDQRRKERHNVICLGDLIADVDFIDSVPELHTSIAVGFLADSPESSPEAKELLEHYLDYYDIVVTSDGSMDVVLAVLQAVAGGSSSQ